MNTVHSMITKQSLSLFRRTKNVHFLVIENKIKANMLWIKMYWAWFSHNHIFGILVLSSTTTSFTNSGIWCVTVGQECPDFFQAITTAAEINADILP